MTGPGNATPQESAHDVTQMLVAWGNGDAQAGDALLATVYAELHSQAARAMRREAVDHTLQATALVHEAYLRLIDQRRIQWRNRAQFFGVAAQLYAGFMEVCHRHQRGGQAPLHIGGAATEHDAVDHFATERISRPLRRRLDGDRVDVSVEDE